MTEVARGGNGKDTAMKKNTDKQTKKKTHVRIELALMLICAVCCIALLLRGITSILGEVGSITELTDTVELTRAESAEDEGYDSDSTVCIVGYNASNGGYAEIKYSYEEWETLPDGHSMIGYVYESEAGDTVILGVSGADEAELLSAVRNTRADENNPIFQSAAAIGLLAISLAVIAFFDAHFTTYEKIWFISIMVLAAVFAILMPEEGTSGVSGIWIMALYLADTFLNILCELLISKQSKWNFIVSVFVEIVEIAICIVLSYRFATMATTLFFWLPCDIISFINWHRHPDRTDDELTEVRTLTGLQEVLIIIGIFVWTIVVGYILSGLDISSELFGGNRTLELIVCYLDACVSAVGVANGLFILFRFREQWIAWYISALIEATINIISGQYILLVLKLGYITNTTYGYIKWTGYIKGKKRAEELSEGKKA